MLWNSEVKVEKFEVVLKILLLNVLIKYCYEKCLGNQMLGVEIKINYWPSFSGEIQKRALVLSSLILFWINTSWFGPKTDNRMQKLLLTSNLSILNLVRNVSKHNEYFWK